MLTVYGNVGINSDLVVPVSDELAIYENILFKKNKVSGIVDFDDCFYGNILSDVGSGIAFWCIDDKIDFEKCSTFIKAYEKERILTSLEKEFLYEQTQMFMLVHLMYWLWEKKNWKDDIKPFKVLNNLKNIKKTEFTKSIFPLIPPNKLIE